MVMSGVRVIILPIMENYQVFQIHRTVHTIQVTTMLGPLLLVVLLGPNGLLNAPAKKPNRDNTHPTLHITVDITTLLHQVMKMDTVKCPHLVSVNG